jgi:hypothetical protein
MTEHNTHARAYRFGPLERRGVVGALRPGQLGLLATSAAAAVAVFRATPGGGGLLLGLVLVATAAVVAFVPVRGRSPEEWAPVLARWLRMHIDGRTEFRCAQPWRGVVAGLDGSGMRRELDLPEALAGCEIVSVPVADGREVGVFCDPAIGALTAVLAVRVRAFGLLGEAEQQRRLARWGQVLAGLARNQTPVRRIGILERTVPSDGDELQRYLVEARDRALAPSDPAWRSYEALLEGAGGVTQDHELFIALQIDERRACARAARTLRHGGATREELARAVLVRELSTFATRFDPSDVVVEGALNPRQLARALRLGFDPYGRQRLNRLAAATPELDGADPGACGPAAASIGWSSYRTDGAVHRTYWVAQWPRLSVGPAFLSPLLLEGEAVRSVAIVLEPVAPDRARRDVEAQITTDEADDQLRAERGFRTTARQRRGQSAARERERELADGHQEVRFAAFVTVSARDADELEIACDRVEQAAQQAHLDVQVMWGEQDLAFTHGALPIARGMVDVAPVGRWWW